MNTLIVIRNVNSLWHSVKVGPGPRDPGPQDPGIRDPPQSLKVEPGTP